MIELWLPLFPLPNTVLFPGMLLPLHVFEPRYRQLMADVLAGDNRFGVMLCQEYNPETLQGQPFDVGTMAKVVEAQLLEDGRWNILAMGTQRFRTISYDETGKSYLQAQVEPLDDTPGNTIPPELMAELGHLFQEALRMSYKIHKKAYKPLVLPADPEELSFVIAENLKGSLVLKQELLAITDTRRRLESEHEVLTRVVKSLAVRTQIEDAFQPEC